MQRVIKETTIQRTPMGVASLSQVDATDTPTQTLANVIYFVFGLFDILLLFRLILKIAGANPGSSFVAAIYGVTNVLILPFQGIFRSAVTTGLEVRSVFEPATLIAMVVYAAIAWGIVRLIAIMAGHSDEEL